MLTDTRQWLRGAGWVATSALLGIAATGMGELSLRTRDEPLTTVLRQHVLDWPQLIRGAWSQRHAASEFGLVTAAVAILVVVAVSGSRRWAGTVPVIGTAGVVAWAVAGWHAGCDAPWPGPTPPLHVWGVESPTLWDVALLGPLTLVGTIWLVALLARRWDLARSTQPGPASRTATAVTAPICGLWAVGGTVAAAVLLANSAVCSMVVPPWWLLLVAVPVAAVASGTGGVPLMLVLATTVALGLDHLRFAAFALDARPLVAVALALTAVLGAGAWRPLARGLDELIAER